MILEFTSFADHILRFAYPAVTVDKRKLAADYSRGIFIALNHDLREHRRNGCLTVSSANTVAVGIEPCYCTEQISTLNGRNSRFFCGNKLRVVRQNCSSINNKLRTCNVLRFLTEDNRNTETANPRQRIGFVIVRPGKHIALLVQNFGKRTHTRAADTDKMNSFNLFEQFIYLVQDIISLICLYTLIIMHTSQKINSKSEYFDTRTKFYHMIQWRQYYREE